MACEPEWGSAICRNDRNNSNVVVDTCHLPVQFLHRFLSLPHIWGCGNGQGWERALSAPWGSRGALLLLSALPGAQRQEPGCTCSLVLPSWPRKQSGINWDRGTRKHPTWSQIPAPTLDSPG